MGQQKHHHIVSQGYLRQFARRAQRGSGRSDFFESRLIRKSTIRIGGSLALEPPVVGIRAMFARSHFNSFVAADGKDSQAERVWSELESLAVPALRRFLDGDRSVTAVGGVGVLVAIHIARSHGAVSLSDRVLGSAAADELPQLLEDTHLTKIWHRTYGRPLTATDLMPMLDRGVEGLRAQRLSLVNTMLRSYNHATEAFAGRALTILRSTGPIDYITGDTPVVLTEAADLKVGLRGGAALHSAELIFMPLSPRLAVQIGGDGGEVEVAGLGVQRLNHLVRRSAHEALAAHPDTDWRRALALL